MDPQQRLLLEVAWEAFEHAAIPPASLAGPNAGVLVGIGQVDYTGLNLTFRVHPDGYGGTGNAASIAANRLSYVFDLHGPNAVVDTACSLLGAGLRSSGLPSAAEPGVPLGRALTKSER